MKNPPHPGELLREDVLVPLGIEVTEAAQRLGMSRTTLSLVITGHYRSCRHQPGSRAPVGAGRRQHGPFLDDASG